MVVTRKRLILYILLSVGAFYLMYTYRITSRQLMASKARRTDNGDYSLTRVDDFYHDFFNLTTSPDVLQQQPLYFSYYNCPLNNNTTILYDNMSFNVSGTTCQINEIEYIIPNADFCRERPSLRYLIYFHAAADDKLSREVLRRTWANSNLFKDGRTAAVYMIGMPKNPTDQKNIIEENQEHGDLVQGEFIEGYRNLSVKATMSLGWVSRNCHHVTHVIKSDVDTFVNIFGLLSFIDRNRFYHLICSCMVRSPVLRGEPSYCSKWCVESQYQFVDRDYPKYCSGLLYIFDVRVAKALYEEAQKVPSFWVDDVFITGMLIARLGTGIHRYDLQASDLAIYNDNMKVQVMNESVPISSISYLATHAGSTIQDILWKYLVNRMPSKYLQEYTTL